MSNHVDNTGDILLLLFAGALGGATATAMGYAAWKHRSQIAARAAAVVGHGTTKGNISLMTAESRLERATAYLTSARSEAAAGSNPTKELVRAWLAYAEGASIVRQGASAGMDVSALETARASAQWALDAFTNDIAARRLL
ncbi:MAG TPA: hypothetical protein VFZ09_01185 [Archangium sp.]|uniref:hypothetical protein n=1 Tax=Archangium sp. TaxID=1872627 RepID=UPI002E374FF9|nr:hypothetical protein [Archangium sp.]HEX5744822.1 hypothetical protein [Archangium sp.]